MLTKTKIINAKNEDVGKIVRKFLNGHNGQKPDEKKKVMVIKKTVITILAYGLVLTFLFV